MTNLYKLFIIYLFIAECGRQGEQLLGIENWVIILIYQVAVVLGFVVVANYFENKQNTK
jgi:hypothetical protein